MFWRVLLKFMKQSGHGYATRSPDFQNGRLPTSLKNYQALLRKLERNKNSLSHQKKSLRRKLPQARLLLLLKLPLLTPALGASFHPQKHRTSIPCPQGLSNLSARSFIFQTNRGARRILKADEIIMAKPRKKKKNLFPLTREGRNKSHNRTHPSVCVSPQSPNMRPSGTSRSQRKTQTALLVPASRALAQRCGRMVNKGGGSGGGLPRVGCDWRGGVRGLEHLPPPLLALGPSQ